MKKKSYLLPILLCLTLIFTIGTAKPTTINANTVGWNTSIDKTYLNTDKLVQYYKENQKNKEPILLIHGLFGWGDDELLGIHYWGCKESLRDYLNAQGFDVYTPTVGPVASCWDRACELYAYIVGGKVDYGKAHAEKYGHSRYGRTYPGICPELLTSKSHKIHLVGHSMGGETARVLAQLLEKGDSSEITATGTETSPLFTGNHHWIRSITTISTPHDGSQTDELANGFGPACKNALTLIGAQTGSQSNPVPLDLRLDQWGLKQNPGEPYNNYLRRVSQSKLWKDTMDISLWALSLEGAKELNSWVEAQKDIYYFSIACCDTHKSILSNHQVPDWNMNSLFISSGYYMGKYVQNSSDKVPVNKDWWANDGLVSVRSAIAPHEGSHDTWRNFDGTTKAGTWNYLGVVDNTDHLEVIWHTNPHRKPELRNLYKNIGYLLYSL